MTRLGKFALVLVSIAVLLFGFAGFKAGWLIDSIAPDAIHNAKGYFEELRQRRADQILEAFDPSADKERLSSDVANVIALVPQETPLGVETLGATVDCKASGIAEDST